MYKRKAATQKTSKPMVWKAPKIGKQARVSAYVRKPIAAVGELKFHDLDINDSVIAQNGNIAEDSVLTIAQGTTESERIGRKLTVKRIGWRFEIKLIAGTASATTNEVVRVILY